MTERRRTKLGELLHRRRIYKELSLSQLEDVTGINRSNIYRIETGDIEKPRADQLAALATALDIPTADVYALAGVPLPTELPTFGPYLRSKNVRR